MNTSDLLPSLLFKPMKIMVAFEAAIFEISNWIEQREAEEVGMNTPGALAAIDFNEEYQDFACGPDDIGMKRRVIRGGRCMQRYYSEDCWFNR